MLGRLGQLVNIEGQYVVALGQAAILLYWSDLDQLSLVVHIECIIIILQI